LKKDSDHDGLADDLEVSLYGTDPHNADSDGDGLSDGREIALGTNPLSADTDGDGRNDKDEVDAGTDPLNADVTPPTVVATDPAANATNVLENHPITITFSEPLRADTVEATSLRVLLGGVAAPGTVRLMPNGLDLVFTPSALLNHLATYTVVVSGVRDLAGNPLASPFNLTF